jgi:phage protein D
MSDLYYCVEIEGEEVSDLLMNLRVDESDQQADMAILTFRDSHHVLSDVLQEGLAVEVNLGCRSSHTLILRGMVTDIQTNQPSQGEPQVEVEVMDSLIRMALRPKDQRWRETTISQIVQDIALDNQLRPGTIDLGEEEREAEVGVDRALMQVAETDLAFLFRLAHDYDCKLYIDHELAGDSLNFISTRRLMQADPIEERLTFNNNLQRFSVSLDTAATAIQARLVTTDPRTGELVDVTTDLREPESADWVPDAERLLRVGEGTERLSRLTTQFRARHPRAEEAWRVPPRALCVASRPSTDRSRATGDYSRRLGQTGSGQATGSIWLRPRRRVRVEGYGGRWSGDWYLAQVEHQLDLDQHDYTCSFTCTR